MGEQTRPSDKFWGGGGGGEPLPPLAASKVDGGSPAARGQLGHEEGRGSRGDFGPVAVLLFGTAPLVQEGRERRTIVDGPWGGRGQVAVGCTLHRVGHARNKRQEERST